MTPSPIHEVFRYWRGDVVRIYNLHTGAGRTALWRVTHEPGQPPNSVMETDFATADECATFLQEVERTLRAGGWREMPLTP